MFLWINSIVTFLLFKFDIFLANNAKPSHLLRNININGRERERKGGEDKAWISFYWCRRDLSENSNYSNFFKLVIIGVWLASAIYSTPKFIFSRTITNVYSDGRHEEICIMHRKLFNSKILDIVNFGALYILPLLVMSVSPLDLSNEILKLSVLPPHLLSAICRRMKKGRKYPLAVRHLKIHFCLSFLW